MPDFFVKLVDGEPKIINILRNGMTLDGVRMQSMQLGSVVLDWRAIAYGTQDELAKVGIFFGEHDAEDHTGKVSDNFFFLEERATDPKTYVRKATWSDAPTALQQPMPAGLLMLFLSSLSGADWLGLWKNFRESNERRRQIANRFEEGTSPFYRATLNKFAAAAGQALPGNVDTRWNQAMNANVANVESTPESAQPWAAQVYFPGSHVTHGGTTWRATFDYAMPAEVPGVSPVWDAV
jgi:hypothetical protein